MGRGRGTKGTRGRGRGRGRKSSRIISSDEENRTDSLELKEDKSEPQEENDQQMADAPEIAIPVEEVEKVHEEPIPHKIDMEGDISQLEAPTFTTITRNIPQPMTQLNWDHKVNLIGHKVLSPMIHCCDQCNKPILIYGRMIPCKHVFCLKCARAENYKTCPRCHDKVNRVEKTGFPIYLCTHGGTLYGSTGCRRTYLSQRDLQAHINHRHLPSQTIQESKLIAESKASNTPTSNPPIQPSHPKKDLLTTHSHAPQSQMTIPPEPTKQFHSLTASHLSNSLQSQSTSRNNLIVTPIQEPHQNSRSIIPENPQLGHNVYYNQLQQNLPYTSGGIANNQPNVEVMQPLVRSNQQPSNFYAHSYGQHVGQHYQQQQGANVQPQWNQQQYYR